MTGLQKSGAHEFAAFSLAQNRPSIIADDFRQPVFGKDMVIRARFAFARHHRILAVPIEGKNAAMKVIFQEFALPGIDIFRSSQDGAKPQRFDFQVFEVPRKIQRGGRIGMEVEHPLLFHHARIFRNIFRRHVEV